MPRNSKFLPSREIERDTQQNVVLSRFLVRNKNIVMNSTRVCEITACEKRAKRFWILSAAKNVLCIVLATMVFIFLPTTFRNGRDTLRFSVTFVRAVLLPR